MFDCPKCVTVCKQPHCVTHCQAPKPECEPVCEEPRCDWKCHKPNCPKPKCELVCENPNCVPKVECCNCALGAPKVSQPFPFFKETEKNQRCCGCGNGDGRTGFGAPSEIPQVVGIDRSLTNTMPSSGYINNGGQMLKVEQTASVEMLKNPVPLGTGTLTGAHVPHAREYEKFRRIINSNLINRDRQ
jgi:hypothetical protein